MKKIASEAIPITSHKTQALLDARAIVREHISADRSLSEELIAERRQEAEQNERRS